MIWIIVAWPCCLCIGPSVMTAVKKIDLRGRGVFDNTESSKMHFTKKIFQTSPNVHPERVSHLSHPMGSLWEVTCGVSGAWSSSRLEWYDVWYPQWWVQRKAIEDGNSSYAMEGRVGGSRAGSEEGIARSEGITRSEGTCEESAARPHEIKNGVPEQFILQVPEDRLVRECAAHSCQCLTVVRQCSAAIQDLQVFFAWLHLTTNLTATGDLQMFQATLSFKYKNLIRRCTKLNPGQLCCSVQIQSKQWSVMHPV